MTDAEDFSHGSYADYSGVAFYGPPIDGFWLDRLAVSDRYIRPLFSAILDRVGADSGGKTAPRLVYEWNALEGWMDADRAVAMGRTDTEGLLEALASVTWVDVAPYCAGCTPEQCIRCASAIRHFVEDRVASGVGVFIEYE